MLVIGIAGGTGSGKTTVVRKIQKQFPKGEVNILSHDSYYFSNSHLSLEERRKKNFDHPDSIEFELMIDHVKQLKKWPCHTRTCLFFYYLHKIRGNPLG